MNVSTGILPDARVVGAENSVQFWEDFLVGQVIHQLRGIVCCFVAKYIGGVNYTWGTKSMRRGTILAAWNGGVYCIQGLNQEMFQKTQHMLWWASSNKHFRQTWAIRLRPWVGMHSQPQTSEKKCPLSVLPPRYWNCLNSADMKAYGEENNHRLVPSNHWAAGARQ